MMSLLHHSSEPYLAFYLFTSLIEDYQLCDVYGEDLSGVNLHCSVLSMLVNVRLPTLQQHFARHNIQIQMFCSEWILTLFSSLVPLELHHHFISNFL